MLAKRIGIYNKKFLIVGGAIEQEEGGCWPFKMKSQIEELVYYELKWVAFLYTIQNLWGLTIVGVGVNKELC